MTNEPENIDDRLDADVMRPHEHPTSREDVSHGARYPASERLSVEDARALRGIGWEGDLQVMRSNRVVRF